MNEGIMPVLLAIREDLGAIKATIEGLPERVNTLEMSHARQRGAAKVWHLVSTAIGSAIGFAAAYFTHEYHR